MQAVSDALRTALRSGAVLDAQPRIIAEWNQNRYAGISVIDNDPTDPSRYDASVVVDPAVTQPQYDFPVSSIAEPNRPTRGIMKARTSPQQASQQYWRDDGRGDEGYTSPGYSDSPDKQRYYTVSADAKYKYWTSPGISNSGGGFALGEEVRPYILYRNLCWTNKIVVVFETTATYPTSYQIQTTTSADNSGWVTVSSNIMPNDKGEVIIYRQSGGTWSATVNRENPVQIRGIRVVVNAVNDMNSHLSLIELSPRLETDISQHVITYDVTHSMSDTNFITPLGKASSNDGSIRLSNIIGTGSPDNGLFNKDNVNSIYYGLIDHNVKFTCDLGYLLDGATEREYVREFEMYSENWGADGAEEIDIPIKDGSKFLQEENAPKLFLQGATVGEIIWRLCDAVGFNRYIYDKKAENPATIVPFFWSDGSETVWGMFQQLAESTQTAIYFDEEGYLRIKTREAAFDETQSPVWTLTSEDLPGASADIIDIQKTADFEANTVNINYKTTTVGEDQHGFPKQDIVWQPNGDFALRSANLVENMTASQTSIRMTATDAITWPYEGLMTLDGEIIRYKGKEYTYNAKEGGQTTVMVNSLDEKKNIDRNLSDPNTYWQNAFTGKFNVIKRGEMQTTARPHEITATGFSGRRHTNGSATTESYAGAFKHNRLASHITVTTPGNWPPNMYYTLTTGSPTDAKYVHYGTSVRIPKAGQLRGTQGMVVCYGAGGSGYYIEIIRSTILNDQAGAGRNAHNEINVGVRKSDGSFTRVGPNSGKGVALAVPEDVWIDIDLTVVEYNSSHYIDIYVNGAHRMGVVMSGANKLPNTGEFGVFGRGPGSVGDYDYLYAFRQTEGVGRPDQSTYMDKVKGGYSSNMFPEYVMRSIGPWGQKNRAKMLAYDTYYFQEFGPVIHEMREMSVTFEKYPVLNSRLWSTNDYQARCPQYNGNPFGAKFILVNTHRETAILAGEDAMTFGAANVVTQHTVIYGRVVFQEEAETYTVKDDSGIYRRGIVAVDFDNKWIQSKAAAVALGDWIINHWSGGNDELSVNIFGNPLFQLGDVVAVHSPEQDIYEDTHRYFVTSIRNSFEVGISTSLTLRRAKI